MKAANIFFGVIILVIFAVMCVPSFPLDVGFGVTINIPNPLYVIFDSFALFTMPVINFGVTIADIIAVVGVILLASGLI